MRTGTATAIVALALACGGCDESPSRGGDPAAAPAAAPAGAGSAQTQPAAVAAPSAAVTPSAAVGPAASLDALAAAGNVFAMDLYGELRGRQGNLALSPASISLAFGMMYAGARGETADQMAAALRLDRAGEGDIHTAFAEQLSRWNDPERTSYELRVANRLFGEGSLGFHGEFLGLTRDRYGAELERVDFLGAAEPSRERINEWVEERTNDLIPDLLPRGSITVDTRLVLANAIYFKGMWEKKFDENRTEPLPFHGPGGKSVVVPTMGQTVDLGHATLDGLQVLRMPYVGGDLAMYVFLPDRNDGIGELEGRMTPEAIETWVAAVREREVRVWIPRFKIEPAGPISLKAALSAMGMSLPFDKAADFTGMTDAKPLYIHDAFHKAFVEVNEEGTEAAAATGVVMGIESAPLEPPAFRADHPFIFAIRDLGTGSILFIGRVMNPAA